MFHLSTWGSCNFFKSVYAAWEASFAALHIHVLCAGYNWSGGSSVTDFNFLRFILLQPDLSMRLLGLLNWWCACAHAKKVICSWHLLCMFFIECLLQMPSMDKMLRGCHFPIVHAVADLRVSTSMHGQRNDMNLDICHPMSPDICFLISLHHMKQGVLSTQSCHGGLSIVTDFCKWAEVERNSPWRASKHRHNF